MTESFDDALVTVHKHRLLSGKMCNRLQRAHDHEMEQLRRSRFREGYEAGQRSMDAERYHLKLRLQRLRFGDGSHENLSRLAYAIYQCPTGWGKESCEGLRDKLVRLLGGVHDEPAQTAASGCACDADCDCGHGDETAVDYDALGNERNKAACMLRGISVDELRKKYDYVYAGTEFIWAIGRAIGVRSGSTYEEIIKRLIYLIGGDESLPNLSRTSAEPDGGENFRITDENLNGESLIESLVKNTEELSRQGKVRFPPNEDGSLDSLKTVEETAALTEDVRRQAAQSHESSPMSQENETGITDELREWWLHKFPVMDKELHQDFRAIADRIDEQFNRICWQQESVLQHTIDSMVDGRNELRQEVRRLKRAAERDADQMEALSAALDDMTIERDELQKKLDELEKFEHDTSLAAFGDDNEELRKLLSRASKLLANAEQDRDTYYAYWMDCKEKVVNGNATIDELEAKLDKVMKEANRHRWEYCETCEVSKTCDELRKSLREIAKRAGVQHDLKLSTYDDDTMAKATVQLVGMMLEEKLDAIWEALDG